MRTILAFLVVTVALALASSASASNTARWVTQRTVVRIAETTGLTLNDGTRIRAAAGYCIGEGPHLGTWASPRFKRFRCTLATLSRYGGTTWYDLRVFPLVGLTWAVVLHRY